MKYILIVFISLMLLVSCKKCYTCENKCYYCEFLNDTLCSNEFLFENMFDNAITMITETGGDNCYIIVPTISFEECDKDKIKIFEDQLFYCYDK